MKKASFVFTGVVLLMFLSSGCIMHYYNHMLKVYNRSNKKITVLYANSEFPKVENNPSFYLADYNTIAPCDTGTIIKGGKDNAWHEYIEEQPSKTLFIYIFSVDEVKKYGGINTMTDLIDTGQYLKKLEFTEQELIRANWTINYR